MMIMNFFTHRHFFVAQKFSLLKESEFNFFIYKKILKLYNQKIINKIFYFFCIVILINYFLFIKIFLNAYDIFLSFLLVILSLLRLNSLFMYNRIKKDICCFDL